MRFVIVSVDVVGGACEYANPMELKIAKMVVSVGSNCYETQWYKFRVQNVKKALSICVNGYRKQISESGIK